MFYCRSYSGIGPPLQGKGEDGPIILSVVRNVYKEPRARLRGHLRVALLHIHLWGGSGGQALSLSLGCRVLTSPPPPHTSLKTTLMSQSSVGSVSDTQGCHTLHAVMEFCKFRPAKPQFSQVCI